MALKAGWPFIEFYCIVKGDKGIEESCLYLEGTGDMHGIWDTHGCCSLTWTQEAAAGQGRWTPEPLAVFSQRGGGSSG